MSEDTAHADVLTATAQSQIRSIVERLERLEQEKAEIAAQIKEVLAEAKGNGFSPKILRKAVSIRKQDRAKRQEEEAILDLYMSALGEAPLFERAYPGPAVSVTFTRPDGGSVTAPIEVVGAALNLMQAEDKAADDDLYRQAVAVVREEGKASTSYVQRRLQLGFNRATSLIERMEREGVVGAPNHAGKREVLQREAA